MAADLRWDDLQLFLALYREKSLTRGAARLGLNQSTMSRRLTTFEESLGARLFDRTPDGLVATDLADRLLEPAERAEAASHDAARVVAGIAHEVDGEVRLALAQGMSLYVIAPAMPRLLSAHPKLRLSLVVGTTLADLTRREADIAIRFVRPESGDLVSKRVYRGDYGVFVSPQLAARLGEGRHPLASLDFIGWDPGQLHFAEGRWERQAGLRFTAHADELATRIAMAQAGVGAIELARDFGAALPGLVEILTSPPCPLTAEVWLVTHRALRDVPRVRAAWDFIETELATLVGHTSGTT